MFQLALLGRGVEIAQLDFQALLEQKVALQQLWQNAYPA
jgi:hypothetical protein